MHDLRNPFSVPGQVSWPNGLLHRQFSPCGVGLHRKIPCVASGEGGAEPEIEVESTGKRVVVLRLLGEHDLASANALTEALAPVLESARSVVLDVRSAEFIDSSIIHRIFRARADATARSLGFSLCLSPTRLPGERWSDRRARRDPLSRHRHGRRSTHRPGLTNLHALGALGSMVWVEMVWVVSFGVRIERGIARLRSKRRFD